MPSPPGWQPLMFGCMAEWLAGSRPETPNWTACQELMVCVPIWSLFTPQTSTVLYSDFYLHGKNPLSMSDSTVKEKQTLFKTEWILKPPSAVTTRRSHFLYDFINLSYCCEQSFAHSSLQNYFSLLEFVKTCFSTGFNQIGVWTCHYNESFSAVLLLIFCCAWDQCLNGDPIWPHICLKNILVYRVLSHT